MTTLTQIHFRYDTDKGTDHSYIETYETLFSNYQNKKINICEIGCLTCASLFMWNEYFKQATIYGVDNWVQQDQNYVIGLNHRHRLHLPELIENVQTNYSRIKLITCDSTDAIKVEDSFKNCQLDIILDDGDHSMTAQFITYTNFIRFLSQDGIYIVEDVSREYVHELTRKINDYNFNHGLTYTVSPKEFYKNNRNDDALLVIKNENY